MALYRISGIRKLQKDFFTEYALRKEGAEREKLCRRMLNYTIQFRKAFSSQGLSPESLNLHSRTAFYNIEGLAHLGLQLPHRYCDIFSRLSKQKSAYAGLKDKKLYLEFSPSERLSHSISMNKQRMTFHISIASLSMKDEYFSHLAQVLMGKITGKVKDSAAKENLLLLENRHLAAQTFDAAPKAGTGSPHGRHYDLLELFHLLNQRYFSNKLPVPAISWSSQFNRRRLGSYDPLQKRLMVTRMLDHSEIPRFVVEGILYHEMLHILHPVEHQNGRRIIHSREFKNDEKKFEQHDRLNSWLKNEFVKLVRNRKRRLK